MNAHFGNAFADGLTVTNVSLLGRTDAGDEARLPDGIAQGF